MKPPQPIADLCQALVHGLKQVLGDKLYGVYVYGAAAFPEAAPTGDIDFHVILAAPLTDTEGAALRDLHAALARDYPPLGAELDGYYLLLTEARQASPPTHQLCPELVDASWALHRAHIRAGRCIPLCGPDPLTLYPTPTWSELETALWSELQYVADHLGDYPDYCILNLCRLMYSFETRDVVISKAGAAAWAYDAFPQWRRHVALAQKSYTGQATPEDRQFMLDQVEELYRFACRHIEKSLGREISGDLLSIERKR
jgi:hypothetical protein